MAQQSITRSHFSRRALPRFTAVDVLSLSPQARRQFVKEVLFPVLTQNAVTLSANAAVLPTNCSLIGGYVTFRTIPAAAGGTATFQVRSIAADGITKVFMTTALTVLAMTNDVPVALVLAATNPVNLPAGTSLELVCTTSNNVVGTAQVGGTVTLLFEPTEDAIISYSTAIAFP